MTIVTASRKSGYGSATGNSTVSLALGTRACGSRGIVSEFASALPIVSFRLPVSDCQLPIASFRLPVSDCQRVTTRILLGVCEVERLARKRRRVLHARVMIRVLLARNARMVVIRTQSASGSRVAAHGVCGYAGLFGREFRCAACPGTTSPRQTRTDPRHSPSASTSVASTSLADPRRSRPLTAEFEISRIDARPSSVIPLGSS